MLVFIWQAWTAARALNAGRELGDELTDAIAKGNVAQARALLAQFDDETTRAHHRTDGPLWTIGAKVPVIGRNLVAVSTIAAEADAIADQALPQVVNVADQVRLETFRPNKGRVDLAAVAETLPVLALADRVLSHADARVGTIKTQSLLAPLRVPVADLQVRTHNTAAAIAAAHRAGQLLPTMLGGKGETRRYLLIVLNNAEVRSLVGMPGSFAVLEAKRGRLSMGRQGAIQDIEPLDTPVLKVKTEVQSGFDSRVGTDIRDVAIIPDFPRAAQLASSIAGRRWDESFDGVVAVDPVALGYVLSAVGAVDIGDGLQINQFTAAPTLLNGIYLRYPKDTKRQDDAFKHAARRTFDALTGGRGNSVLAIRALVRGVQERRIMLWSKHRKEQARIQSGGIAAPFTDLKQLARPQVGVFVTDAGSSKMSYYLRMGTRVQTTQCFLDGAQEMTITTTLRSEAPQGGRALPLYVTGRSRFVNRGDIALSVRVVAPLEGQILSMLVDGRRAPVGGLKYHGRPIARVARNIPPGESTVIVTQITSPEGTPGDPLLRTTPGVLENEDSADASACAS